MEEKCELCGRMKILSFHHLIPKTLHNNKVFKKLYEHKYMATHGLDLCHDCHKNIHVFYTEKELGKYYYTKELLLSSEKVRNFLKWVKKQD